MAAGDYAKPRYITDLADCTFYHTFDLPHSGHVIGHTDLRGRERSYLGQVSFAGKRVLEIGTASGYLAFWMEREGAEVVGFDLSEDYYLDVAPYAGFTRAAELESRARVVYGSVYAIPGEIGPVDIASFCRTLVRFENPFRALQFALRLTRETVIVTEVIWNRFLPSFLLGMLGSPSATFVSNHESEQASDAWCFLPPGLVRRFLGVLGFESSEVRYFVHRGHGGPRLAYSVVGRRTVDFSTP